MDSTAPRPPESPVGVESIEQAEPSEPVLGQVLRRARRHRGWSLRDVERRTGVSNAHLSQIERGVIRCPERVVLLQLSDLYLLDLNLILAWAGHRTPNDAQPEDGDVQAAVMRVVGELNSTDQWDVLRYAEQLRQRADRRRQFSG